MCNCQSWRSYNFHVRSLDQIDYDLIESELSHKNPVLIVEVDGIQGVKVLIHESIWNKADSSGRTKRPDHNRTYAVKKLVHDLLELEGEGAMENGFVSKEVASKMLHVVRRIKKARWDEPYRAEVRVRRADVSV